MFPLDLDYGTDERNVPSACLAVRRRDIASQAALRQAGNPALQAREAHRIVE